MRLGPPTEDSLRAYFAGIGNERLLTRDEEVSLAMRVESAEAEIARVLAGSELAVAELVATANALRDERLRPREVTRRSTGEDGDAERARTNRIFLPIRRLARAQRIGARGPNFKREKERAERALGALRPSRLLLERIVDALRARGDGELNPGATPLEAMQLEALRVTLAAVSRVEHEAARARARLVKPNLRLVISIAKKLRYEGVQLIDLVQAGNIGLMRAVDKFDYQRGYRFSTYATLWIRQSIRRSFADTGRTIRLPIHVSAVARDVAKTRRTLEGERARSATVEELAEASGLSEETVGAAIRASREPASLDATTDLDGRCLGDTLEDPERQQPFETLLSKLVAAAATELLEHLTARERDVLRMRFGLGDARERTADEIGQCLSLTPRRVRQIDIGALRKLRELTNHLPME